MGREDRKRKQMMTQMLRCGTPAKRQRKDKGKGNKTLAKQYADKDAPKRNGRKEDGRLLLQHGQHVQLGLDQLLKLVTVDARGTCQHVQTLDAARDVLLDAKLALLLAAGRRLELGHDDGRAAGSAASAQRRRPMARR